MKKWILLLFLCLLSVWIAPARADLAPQITHRVLVVSTNSLNAAFPGGISNGYSAEVLVWLLERLGFKVTMWLTNTTKNFSAVDTTIVQLKSRQYDALFLVDVSAANHATLMRNFVNAAVDANLPAYIIAKNNGSLAGSPFCLGATVARWNPQSNPCPLTMSGLGATDTLWLHGYKDNDHATLYYVPDDSLTPAGGHTVTRLIYRADTTSSVVAWKWDNIRIFGVISPPLSSYLVAAQFLRDKAYSPYVDYVPLPLTLQLDCDGIESTPWGGATALRWLDLATQVRNSGLHYLYFSVWEDALNTHCDSLASAWSQIQDVVKISIHGPKAARSANNIWSGIAYTDYQDFQTCWTASYTGFRSILSTLPPDTTVDQLQTHRYDWTIYNARFFKNKGVQVLSAMEYGPTRAASNYILRAYHCQFMRFHPDSCDLAEWIQIVPFHNATMGDWADYDSCYASTHGGTRALAAGYLTSYLADYLSRGFQPYFHVPEIVGKPTTNDAVWPQFYGPAVFVPFVKSTRELWELDNTGANLKRLAIRNPVASGLDAPWH